MDELERTLGKVPRIGQQTTVHGRPCTIVAVFDGGTIEVEEVNGPGAWLVSGLPFIFAHKEDKQ